jgi:hypothetical protein
MSKRSADEKRAEALEDARVARGAAAVLAFSLDMAPEAFFRGTRGSAAEAEARQALMLVLYHALERPSLKRLGAALGQGGNEARHRTTVAHALHKVDTLSEDDPALDAWVQEHAAIVRRLAAIGAFTLKEIEAGAEAARPHRDDRAEGAQNGARA